MRAVLYTGLFLTLAVSFASVSYGQVLGSLATVEISLQPEYPQPGQLVQATVSSSSENVRAATVVWLLDNEIVQQEEGVPSYTFTAGDIGSSQTLGVLVKLPSGQVLAKTINIQPAQVTLLWEANTYTPPFYEGRALYSSGSSIRAEAIPNFIDENGEVYDADSLIYTWSKNGTVLGDVSGVRAKSIITSGPKFFGNYILGVEVATPDGTQIARSAARVETQEPMVKLYVNDPLIGVEYHKAINSNLGLSGSSQIEVQAVPFFMDIIHENDEYLDYSWHVNGVEVFGRQNSPSLLNIQLSTQERVSTNIRVVIDHALHLLQTGKGDFDVVFEGSARNSLFGL